MPSKIYTTIATDPAGLLKQSPFLRVFNGMNESLSRQVNPYASY